ncbi:MAG: hypothetical protein KC503_20315 [Myxococcales bacterium]|nr:hypothetical protein [Myxococcales bacterium]
MMRDIKMRFALLILLATVLGACGAEVDQPAWPNGPTPGGPSNPTNPDPGSSQRPTLIQAVVDHVTLPENALDFAVDFGDGMARNRLGGLFAAVRAAFPNMKVTDMEVALVERPLLLELLGSSTLNDDKARLIGYVGDRVAKAAENLSTDKYTISADDPGLAAIRANIRQGRVDAGPGRMTVPLPDDKTANGSVPRLLGLARTQISFDVDLVGGTIQNGVLAGAISVAAVRKNLMPLLHEQLLKLAAEGGELQRVLGRLFDLDADGTITFDEMLASNPVKLALSADVDTDGDGTADAISFGLGFRGKAVRIEHDLQ